MKPILLRKRKVRKAIEEDSTGLEQAVQEFNEHDGPARIFYNRISRVFYVQTYPGGAERLWKDDLCVGIDYLELYRKTTPWGDIQVTKDELKAMEESIEPYSVW